MADGIRGDYVKDCVESDFRDQNSLLDILTNLSKGDQRENHFEFNENFNEITDEEV